MPSWFIKNRPWHPLRALLGPRSPGSSQGWLKGGRSAGRAGTFPAELGAALGHRDSTEGQTWLGTGGGTVTSSLHLLFVPPEAFLAQVLPPNRSSSSGSVRNRLWHFGVSGAELRSLQEEEVLLALRIAREVKWLLRGHLVIAQELRSRAQLLMLSSWCSLPSLCSDSLGKRKSPWTALLANTKPKNLGSRPMDLLQLAPSVGEKQVF